MTNTKLDPAATTSPSAASTTVTTPTAHLGNGDFLVPNTVISDAILEYGGHLTVAAALASFGMVAIQSPAFDLSPIARGALIGVCLGGPGIWVAIGINQLLTRLARYPFRAAIISLGGFGIGMGAIFAVIEYSEAIRIAAVCERVEALPGNPMARADRCKYYYESRRKSEAKLIEVPTPATEKN